jgi:hypothetical protein
VKIVKAVVPGDRVTDLISMSEHEIRCRLALSIVKLQKRAKHFDPGIGSWHPRSKALDEFARAEWEAREQENRDRATPKNE